MPRDKGSQTLSDGATDSRHQTDVQLHVDIQDKRPGTISGGLHRGLSARQVQMIAVAGTIGTGLFLGTGRSLAQGGPASMLICYAIVGFIVYVTLLLLGEMATQYPVAGAFFSFLFLLWNPDR
jgi:amino acid permease